MTTWNELDYEGKQAKARRANELLSECGWLFDECVAVRLDAIKASPAEARDKREAAYQEIRVIEYFRAHLGGIATDMALENKAREMKAAAKRSGPLEE